MNPCVATFLEPDDLMTWPPISSLSPMRSLYRWSHRRSYDRFYTVNKNSPQANGKRWNRNRNLIAGQRLPFETLCIESRLTAIVVVTGGLAVGHSIFERDPCGLERFQEWRCRVAEYLVGVSAAG